jgi:hypothetical protein
VCSPIKLALPGALTILKHSLLTFVMLASLLNMALILWAAISVRAPSLQEARSQSTFISQIKVDMGNYDGQAYSGVRQDT